MLERYTAQYAIIYLKYFRSCRNYLSQCFKKDNIIPPSNIIPDHQKRIRNFYSLTFPNYSIKSGTKGFYKRYAIFYLETLIHFSTAIYLIEHLKKNSMEYFLFLRKYQQGSHKSEYWNPFLYNLFIWHAHFRYIVSTHKNPAVASEQLRRDSKNGKYQSKTRYMSS